MHPEFEFRTRVVPVLGLETLLADQGAEADVFEAAAAVVDRKVASLFIETTAFR